MSTHPGHRWSKNTKASQDYAEDQRNGIADYRFFHVHHYSSFIRNLRRGRCVHCACIVGRIDPVASKQKQAMSSRGADAGASEIFKSLTTKCRQGRGRRAKNHGTNNSEQHAAQQRCNRIQCTSNHLIDRQFPV